MRKRNTIIVVMLAGALGASAAVAQNPKNAGAMNSPAAKQADKASKTFIKNAIEGDIAEVNVGKLAQDKDQSQAAKDFGAMLVKDHSEHKAKAEEVASQIGVKPPTGSSIGEKATYAKLKVLSGASFDRAFASAMVKDHTADIKEYKRESAKGDPAGKLAQETLPTLQRHLQTAQQLEGQLKQSSRLRKHWRLLMPDACARCGNAASAFSCLREFWEGECAHSACVLPQHSHDSRALNVTR